MKTTHSFDEILTIVKYLEKKDFQVNEKELAGVIQEDVSYLRQLIKTRFQSNVHSFIDFLQIKTSRNQLKQGRNHLRRKEQASLWNQPIANRDFLSISKAKLKPEEIVQLTVNKINTPFGFAYVAECSKGICDLHFGLSKTDMVEFLKYRYPNAKLLTGKGIETNKVISFFKNNLKSSAKIQVVLLGTEFQNKVWCSLTDIPSGMLLSYGDIAKQVGTIKSTRAVATAIGNNNLGYLIPCHRVVRSTGETTGYRWAHERKLAILAYEFAQLY